MWSGFFAAGDDQRSILDFVLQQLGMRVFEYAPPYGQVPKEFCSIAELDAAYELGVDVHGSGSATLLSLYVPTLAGELRIVETPLNPSKCKGHDRRYAVSGIGAMYLWFGGVHEKKERCITKSTFSHVSQRRAEMFGEGAEVDWVLLNKVSNKIQYHLRKRMAAVYLPGCPVLPHAFRLAQEGYMLKEAAGSPDFWQLPLLDTFLRPS